MFSFPYYRKLVNRFNDRLAQRTIIITKFLIMLHQKHILKIFQIGAPVQLANLCEPFKYFLIILTDA